jgi:hypothetical protein
MESSVDRNGDESRIVLHLCKFHKTMADQSWYENHKNDLRRVLLND